MNGAIIITTKTGLLHEFYQKLLSEGLDVHLNLNLAVHKPMDNLYIDYLNEITTADGFDNESIEKYKTILGDFTGTLTGYYLSYHGTDFLHRILLAIANRPDVVVDNDQGIILRGDQFAQWILIEKTTEKPAQREYYPLIEKSRIDIDIIVTRIVLGLAVIAAFVLYLSRK
jgi:hypothetical protein